MKYVLVVNNVVVQVQPDPEAGFIEAADDVVPFMITSDNGVSFHMPVKLQHDIDATFNANISQQLDALRTVKILVAMENFNFDKSDTIAEGIILVYRASRKTLTDQYRLDSNNMVII